MDYSKLKDLLEKNSRWPCDYTFKFIIPSANLGELKSVFILENLILKPSKNGKYTSLSFTKKEKDPESVILTYQAVSHIKNLIML